jgi:hypothetical protein
MIVFENTSIFNSKSDAIVNPVNCVGVSIGKLNINFKKKYPNNFLNYKIACELGTVNIGKCFVFKENNLLIINFPIKYDFKDSQEYIYIDDGLKNLKTILTKLSPSSISIPNLIIENGNLNFNIVKKQIEYNLGNLENTKVIVHI